MLPDPHSDEFPSALKQARIAKGMSRAELAKAAGIHVVMPRRYEEPECGEFTRPVAKTYLALNEALGFSQTPIEHGVSLQDASLEQIVAELKRRNISATLSFG